MTYEKLMAKVNDEKVERKIVVAHATDKSLFYVAKTALQQGFSQFIFVGPIAEMKTLTKEVNFPDKYQPLITFVDAKNDVDSAHISVELVKTGEADVLMKGMLSTSILLKAVLDKERGLRTGKILSHVAGFSLPNRHQLLFITDAAMNIAPDLKEKGEIIQNAVDVVNKIGVKNPKVAVVAAVETVNPAMQATLDAAALTLMNRRGQITNCIVDGPLSFDNAISKESALQKNIVSDVAGDADIIVVPTVEVGNVLYKSLTYFGGAVVGGIIVGAKAPIILTSRADTVESKLFSMAMAVSTSASSK